MNVLRGTALALAVVVVAVLGVWAGSRLRRATPLEVRTPAPPALAFEVGSAFPGVAVQSGDGAWTTTAELVRGRGAVVLLLDLECGPCQTMIEQWNARATSDSLRDVRIVGITHFPIERIAGYRRDHDVPFPVYADTAAAFVRVHGVSDFPVCVILDRDMAIREVTFDPYAETPADSIRAWVAR